MLIISHSGNYLIGRSNFKVSKSLKSQDIIVILRNTHRNKGVTTHPLKSKYTARLHCTSNFKFLSFNFNIPTLKWKSRDVHIRGRSQTTFTKGGG